jgi:hypothetical protein
MTQEKLAGIMLLDSPAQEGYKEALDASDYFAPLKGGTAAVSGAGFNGANKYGMVDLVCFTNQAGKLTGGSDINLTASMESLSNILAAAVLKKAGGDEKKESDPASWEAGYNALVRLFCSDYAKTVTKYHDKVIGPGALEEVMKIGFDVDGEPDGNLKTAITNYLKNQGGIIEHMNYGGEISNTYTLVGFSNFVKNGVHRCCFTAYFTTLDAKTAKISKTCEDDKMQFDFSFEITRGRPVDRKRVEL